MINTDTSLNNIASQNTTMHSIEVTARVHPLMLTRCLTSSRFNAQQIKCNMTIDLLLPTRYLFGIREVKISYVLQYQLPKLTESMAAQDMGLKLLANVLHRLRLVRLACHPGNPVVVLAIPPPLPGAAQVFNLRLTLNPLRLKTANGFETRK